MTYEERKELFQEFWNQSNFNCSCVYLLNLSTKSRIQHKKNYFKWNTVGLKTFPSPRLVTIPRLKRTFFTYISACYPGRRREGFMPSLKRFVGSGMQSAWCRVWTWFSLSSFLTVNTHTYTQRKKNIYTHTNINTQSIVLMGKVFANGLGDWGSIPDQVISKTQKMVLDTSLLNTQHNKVRIKCKWSNPGKM